MLEYSAGVAHTIMLSQRRAQAACGHTPTWIVSSTGCTSRAGRATVTEAGPSHAEPVRLPAMFSSRQEALGRR